MRINRNNYEAYLLDLSEGNLSDEMQRELNSFLASNPDLEAEFVDDFLTIEEGSKKFIEKDLLRFDSINQWNRKHFFIAYHEGDLSSQEKNKVFDFIAINTQFKAEFDQFSQLYLKPTGEIFENKKELHSIASSSNTKGLIYWSVRVAAILIIGFILNILLQDIPSMSPKYSFANSRLNLKPSIQKDEDNDISSFLERKNIQYQQTSSNFIAHIEEKDPTPNDEAIKQEQPDKKRKQDQLNNNAVDNNQNIIQKRNPVLNEVIASLNSKKQNEDDTDLKSLPTKAAQTPISLLAFLGNKAKEKELLTDNGRPNFISLINKGSQTISGQDVLAQSESEKSNSTIFQLGGLKIERINKK